MTIAEIVTVLSEWPLDPWPVTLLIWLDRGRAAVDVGYGVHAKKTDLIKFAFGRDLRLL
jgi:hypothetical protein